MWNLKYDTDESAYKTETDRYRKIENKLVYEGWERDKLGIWN